MPLASPNILNYTVGKGGVFVRLTGETNFRHIGNCPNFSFTPEIEELEHFSSMDGTKTVDRTIVLSKKGTLNVTFEEMTPENLRIALLGGDISTESGGDMEFSIFSNNAIRAEVKFVGSNDVGPREEWYFPAVDFIPSDEIPVISEEWRQIGISGKVSAVNGAFGTWRYVRDGV